MNVVTIRKALERLIDKEAVLCTGRGEVYSASSKRHEVIHTKDPRALGVFHVQNVNMAAAMKTWMWHFHGVVTKYLRHYLGVQAVAA